MLVLHRLFVCANLSLVFCHLAQPLHIPFESPFQRHLPLHWHMRCQPGLDTRAHSIPLSEQEKWLDFHYDFHFHWNAAVAVAVVVACLFWLLFATIETCVNRILTSIMLISSRVRKANGYLMPSTVCVCARMCLGFLFCFHKQRKHLKLLDERNLT